MSITIPTYDWNFLIDGTTEDVILDQISNTSATYETDITSDTTDGATTTSTTGRIRVDNSNLSFTSQYSIEMLVRCNENKSNSTLFIFNKYDNQNQIRAYLDGANLVFQQFTNTDGVSGSENAVLNTYSSGSYTGSSISIDGTVFNHFVFSVDNVNGNAYIYQNGVKVFEQTGISIDLNAFPMTFSSYVMFARWSGVSRISIKKCRVWPSHALSATEITTLYNNRETNYFSLPNMRIIYGDLYLSENLIKTFADYKAENIPLQDISFASFPINRFKESYILGDVDISGDTILRSNNTYFTDISADTFDISGNLLMSDLSANGRLFVDGDVSFNSNVTIHGDLSFGADVSFNATFTRSQANIGTGAGFVMNTDFSMNANLELNGTTTIKNDLHFNAYSDVSANPVLTDGTLLHNQKMEKLDHRYLLDISRSAPFSTLNYNTLPSEIWDNSANSGICISGDGKYIRTVNSSDVSTDAVSYYSEDYGSSFYKDETLSQNLSTADISFNTSDSYNNYYGVIEPGVTITDAPTFGTYLTSGSESTQTFTVNEITYTCSLSDGVLGTDYGIWKAFQSSTNGTTSTCCTSRTNNFNTYDNTSHFTNRTISYNDFNGDSQSVNAQFMTININDGNSGYYQVTQVKANSVYGGNYVSEWMIFGRDEAGNTVQLSNASSQTYTIPSTITIVDQTTKVNQIYIAATKGYANNKFVSFHNIEFSLATPDSITPVTNFKCGSDKAFMSYDGQHQLAPRGLSNKLTYDDYLYISNDFGKNWALRKSSTLRTFNYTVTANGSSNYIFNGETYTSEAQPSVNIGPNESVVFTIDTTTNSSHPFKIGTSENGGEITDSTITSVTSGSNQVITFTPTTSGTFYYYCDYHSGMGGYITVANYNMGQFNTTSWFWNTGAVSADGKHMYVSGSTGIWKSQDFGTSWYQASADSSFNYMSISADGKQVYGVNERKVYGSSNYGNTFTTLYTDSYTSDSSYCGISTSGNGKYITIADTKGSDIYMSSNYGNTFDLTPADTVLPSVNCGMSHSGKIILNSNYISFDYGNNFLFVPDLISNNLSNRDSFYSKASMEYLLDPSNNSLLQIPYKSAIFQDIYSVGTVTVGSTTYSSDYRLKENVEELNEEDTVNELKPVKYYNTNLHRNDYGLLAHELQEKYPFLVNGEKDGPDPQSINYNGLISLLVHEVKNLKKEYLTLKKTRK